MELISIIQNGRSKKAYGLSNKRRHHVVTAIVKDYQIVNHRRDF